MNHVPHSAHTSSASHSTSAHIGQGSLLSYTMGFVLSIACTIAAFYATSFSYDIAVICIIVAAVVQLYIQLAFFLHIGKRGQPESHEFILWFTFLIVAILVGGTIWIMTNLDHLHMQMPTMNDLYQGGVVAPQNELK